MKHEILIGSLALLITLLHGMYPKMLPAFGAYLAEVNSAHSIITMLLIIIIIQQFKIYNLKKEGN